MKIKHMYLHFTAHLKSFLEQQSLSLYIARVCLFMATVALKVASEENLRGKQQ